MTLPIATARSETDLPHRPDDETIIVEITVFRHKHQRHAGGARIAAGPQYVKSWFSQFEHSFAVMTQELLENGHEFSVIAVQEETSWMQMASFKQVQAEGKAECELFLEGVKR